MRRRDLIAGLAGGAVIVGGGAVAVGGLPSLGDDVPDPVDPVDVEAIDARGSEAGTKTIPADDGLTVVTFFATTCTTCERKAPELAQTRTEVEGAWFVSVTTQRVAEDAVPESEVVDWFESSGGEWTVAHDPGSNLTIPYDVQRIPKTAVVDPEGRIWWDHVGYADAAELMAGIEEAREDAIANGAL